MIDIGSHVVCLISVWYDDDEAHLYKELVSPVRGRVYTVRAIDNRSGGVGLRFEEIVNDFIDTFYDGCVEPSFHIDYFKPLSKLNANDYLHVKILVDA